MEVFGKKPISKHARLLTILHRFGGYLFLVFLIWISWVGIDLVGKMAAIGKPLDARIVIHIVWAMTLFMVLLIKISHIRFYRNFRPTVPALGMVLSGGTIALWGIAGLVYLTILKAGG
jgi:hypothetical protein